MWEKSVEMIAVLGAPPGAHGIFTKDSRFGYKIKEKNRA